MLHKLLAKSICSICCVVFLQMNMANAQMPMELPQADTLSLSIKGAEKLFLDKNLALLAAHYNIQSSQALVEQARKWDNPYLSTGQNIYNKEEGFFKHGQTTDSFGNVNPQGEFSADLEQLIKTAGKRRKQIDIAKTNVSLAEWQFNSTMRSLKATLFSDFYTIAQLEGNARLYSENMERLNKLLKGMEGQLQLGNIAKKEYLRVQALVVSQQQDIADNVKSLNDAEAELKTILRVTGNTYIKPEAADTERADLPVIGLMQLIDSAKQHNTDYQTEIYQLQLQKQTLRLQKALAVPDLTIGVNFDEHATYTPNYYGLNIGLPIPLWDRNQGNIKSARRLVSAEEANMQQAETKLQNDVMNAYQKLLVSAKLNSGTNRQFYKDYYLIFNNVADAFNKRQISLLEFLDYFNDYRDTREKELQQTLNLRLAKENLNDIVGVEIME